MTDTIEQKMQTLLDEARTGIPLASEWAIQNVALRRAIEQHEAFRQEVSDAVEAYRDTHGSGDAWLTLYSFVIAKPVDPLVEVLNDMKDGRAGPTTESYAACLRAAIEKRGGKIVWGEG